MELPSPNPSPRCISYTYPPLWYMHCAYSCTSSRHALPSLFGLPFSRARFRDAVVAGLNNEFERRACLLACKAQFEEKECPIEFLGRLLLVHERRAFVCDRVVAEPSTMSFRLPKHRDVIGRKEYELDQQFKVTLHQSIYEEILL